MENSKIYTQPSPNSGAIYLKRISWSAIFAGVLVAIVTQMLLSLLGFGIGLGTIDAIEEKNPAAGLGIGSAIWYIISSLISLFAGSWVAGRLASAPRLFDGILHGVLTWCLVTLLTIYFLTTTIGSIIGGTGRLVGGLVKTAGAGIAAAAPGMGDAIQGQLKNEGVDINKLDLSDLKSEANKLLRQTGDPALNPDKLEQKAGRAADKAGNAAENAAADPGNADDIAGSVFKNLFKEGQATVSQIDRHDAVNVVMKRTGKTQQESEQIVDNWINTYKQAQVKIEQAKKDAEVKARQLADDAAAAASKAAIFGFLGLVIGVAAACYGAKIGTQSQGDPNRFDEPVGSLR
ncbi:hypothetical protein L0657_26850 [Dyadobacter sp. CY345]|uniref:hypothetical protein n=1 Tax=Dyadobacter sp. CY345 TaxID=2909335 RepID=UPI001F2F3A40|nr:hypothetical protein [Dyadobacter sp. CY345]MCF2447603.1 hypothetical protein [Dyadobacter sp. CY345]